jgi:uncharacterized membrane protein YwzB
MKSVSITRKAILITILLILLTIILGALISYFLSEILPILMKTQFPKMVFV